VVEGVGGWMVPLGERLTMAEVARALGLPVILVVGLRLGCLNHALLTVEAIRRADIPLAGWIANRIDPAMTHAPENIAALKQRIEAPLLAQIPFRSAAKSDIAATMLPIDEMIMRFNTGH
jgi:dethiobiotin synthetase